jgi:hypothetical protein
MQQLNRKQDTMIVDIVPLVQRGTNMVGVLNAFETVMMMMMFT